MNHFVVLAAAAAGVFSIASIEARTGSKAIGSPTGSPNDEYRVLAPLESGNLLLFPVVKVSGKSPQGTPFLTLDEGLKSGEVEVTEAGRVHGLVRPRPGTGSGPAPDMGYRGDQVNTLVLVNHSGRPLLLLAGEIVTGGKQDRVIAKDRIVPAGGDPIDLSVFCIEPGRWVASSDKFGATAKSAAESFMVQPTVRQQAMVKKDQQEVWNSVRGSIAQMAAATPIGVAGSAGRGTGVSQSSNLSATTSYAKAMQQGAVSAKVDEAAAPVMKSREQVLVRLRQQQAVGVVVAVRGEIVWADIFADTELLSRYWTKLVRSYAAESLTGGDSKAAPTEADAQHFLDVPVEGAETSEGEVGIYRYRELNLDGAKTFVLESLLPATGYDVHISRVKIGGGLSHSRPETWR